ncbi:VWA domain-containing protein [Neobacillus sp. D3-1R]|uniref:VWA domain-containing protein n=1 Tax=Neobacillus sp. D3-1R TaxID=3445778 RepID=UPI003F9FB295
MYKNTCMKSLLALFLMFGMLLSPITSITSYAETPPLEEAIVKSVNWLEATQNEDGSWGSAELAFLNTTEVADYLSKNNRLPANVEKSKTWLQQLEIHNFDVASRVLPLIQNYDLQNLLILSQNEDGGWGIAEGYESDILDTTLILNALTAMEDTDPAVLENAVNYLISKQQANGSWAFNQVDDSVISLTAQTVLALSEFQTKTNRTSSELQTALRLAGEYLVSTQTWGMDEDSIMDSLLSYRAILNTVGADVLKNIDNSIVSVQQSDGSWFSDPYLTALALKALQEKMNMPFAKIDSIQLWKNENDSQIESYSYNAYDSFEIRVDSTFDANQATLLYFIKQKNGTIISAQTDGLPGWNTKNSLPGDYSVIAQVKDNTSGRIIASLEKPFVINPTFTIGAVSIATDPENKRVNTSGEVSTEITIISNSNMDKSLTLKTSVMDGTTVMAEDTKTFESKAADQISRIRSLIFTPDTTVPKDYLIKSEVFDGTNVIAQGEKTFQVLPPPPPTRIDATQSTDKTVLFPGTDSVTAQLKLKGEGTPDMPKRNPIDLILTIDNSGSMEWGDRDWSTTKPWRIDFAKDASKRVVDLLQIQDKGAVVEFAGSVWIQQDLTADKELLKKRITETPPSPWDGTDIARGLSKAMEILNNKSEEGRDKVIVLLSDGDSSRYYAMREAEKAKAKGYKIFSIALGAGADRYLMEQLAIMTGGKYVYSPTMAQLDEMMTMLAGEIFDNAGEDVVLETTIPANGMTVDPLKINPAPSSIDEHADGSKTLKWTMDRMVIGEEKPFEVTYEGTNLLSDTTVHLTKNTKLTYVDKNKTTVTVNLPDLKIPVNKYLLDSKVETDKVSYQANENVTITNTATNLTKEASTLTGKVEITDADGNLVEVVEENIPMTWNSSESKTTTFTWNSSQTMAGLYKVKVTWSENDKAISVTEASFEIEADGDLTSSITVDKQQYAADEEVRIRTDLINNSTNSIENNLILKTTITDEQGNIIWTAEQAASELLPAAQLTLTSNWNTAQNKPGIYTVTAEVLKGEVKLSESTATFEIVSEKEGVMGVSGNIQVLEKNIYPVDPVQFKYILNNTGNVNLTDVTARIRIVDTASEKVLGTIQEKTDIEIGSSYTAEKAWEHEPLETGVYMVVFDAILANGKEVPLGSSYIQVEKPYETTLSQIVSPRVLVWAESNNNINLAKETLESMSAFYQMVDNRDDFMSELRTGKYNLYMLLDSQLPLTGHDDEELAAEVAKGNGIIASHHANGDNFKNMDLFGVKVKGSTTPHDYKVDFLANSYFGPFTLSGTGKALNVELEGGEQQAVLTSKKGDSPGVVTSNYENGKTLLFTFDLGSSQGETSTILKKSIELVTPTIETSNQYTELEVKVKANTSIGAEIILTTPQGSEVVWMSPDTSAWRFETVTGQEYTFRVLLKLPEAAGTYPVTLDSYYATANGMLKFNTMETMIARE